MSWQEQVLSLWVFQVLDFWELGEAYAGDLRFLYEVGVFEFSSKFLFVFVVKLVVLKRLFVVKIGVIKEDFDNDYEGRQQEGL